MARFEDLGFSFALTHLFGHEGRKDNTVKEKERLLFTMIKASFPEEVAIVPKAMRRYRARFTLSIASEIYS